MHRSLHSWTLDLLLSSSSDIYPDYIILTKILTWLQNAAEKPPKFLPGWTAMFVINTFIVIWVLVIGFGFGGWASVTNFVRQVDTFGLFAKCYQCKPPPPPQKHWVNSLQLNRVWPISCFCIFCNIYMGGIKYFPYMCAGFHPSFSIFDLFFLF